MALMLSAVYRDFMKYSMRNQVTSGSLIRKNTGFCSGRNWQQQWPEKRHIFTKLRWTKMSPVGPPSCKFFSADLVFNMCQQILM